MSNFVPTPWLLPNGNNLWFSDSVPTLSSDVIGMNLQPGDYLWIVNTSSNMPFIYKLIAAPSTTYAGGQWQEVGASGNGIFTKSAAYTINGNTDAVVVVSSNCAITLPSAVSFPLKRVTVINGAATSTTVVPVSSQKIGNSHSTNATLGAADSAITLVSDGTQWWPVSSTGTVSYN